MEQNFQSGTMGGKEMHDWIKDAAQLFSELQDFMIWFLGEFDGQLCAITVFMICDWLTSMLTAVMKQKWSLKEGMNEAMRKIFIFVLIGIANVIDVQIMPNDFQIRDVVILFYLAKEGQNCLKNAVIAGIPIPEKLRELLVKMEKNAEAK